MVIFLFIKVFTPYLDAQMCSQQFVMPIIPELFKVQKFSLNEIYKNSWVGPIENCQANRFLTIWQNIIFGRKFMAITTTRSLMVVSPSVKQGWEKIHPTGAAPERAVSGASKREKMRQMWLQVWEYCKKWNILVRNLLDFVCFT